METEIRNRVAECCRQYTADDGAGNNVIEEMVDIIILQAKKTNTSVAFWGSLKETYSEEFSFALGYLWPKLRRFTAKTVEHIRENVVHRASQPPRNPTAKFVNAVYFMLPRHEAGDPHRNLCYISISKRSIEEGGMLFEPFVQIDWFESLTLKKAVHWYLRPFHVKHQIFELTPKQVERVACMSPRKLIDCWMMATDGKKWIPPKLLRAGDPLTDAGIACHNP